MKEQWKDIEGFEGLYQISNTGKVKSFKKSTKLGSPSEYILTPTTAENGYANVTLYRSGKKRKFLVHRLVANAFIPNPNNFPQINHRDEDKLNNNVENLEWCTAKYNNKYGTASIRAAITKGRKVEQYLPTGEHLATYTCVSVASKITGVKPYSIKDCCCGKSATGGGYLWKYQ